MSAAFSWVRSDYVTTCGKALGSYVRFILRAARLIFLAVFFGPLTLATTLAHDKTGQFDKLKKTLTDATESLTAFYDDGNHIGEELEKVRKAMDAIGLRRRQTFLEQRSGELKAWLDGNEVIRTDEKLIQSLNSLIDTAIVYEGMDRSNAAYRRAQRLLDILDKEVTWRNDPSWGELENVIKKLEAIEGMYPISALNRRSEGLKMLADELAKNGDLTGLRLSILAKLRISLNVLEAKLNPAASASAQATELTTLISSDADNIKAIRASSNALTKLVALERQIESVVAEVVAPRVHVVNAIYGDIRDGASDARRCDATAALVESCERAKTCTITTPREICGYDPVPFAEIRHKALVLTYSCVSADDGYWNFLQQDRGASLNNYPSFTVRLRTAHEQVKCDAVRR